ncbi:hypothetical protein H072_11507 [Dactylellina haptotyla CBS 200.50]|uniref:Uncharacterized protein n=1 Tax=Dactylellina haptotyla (strain CBS 200.50) TaxID=1284197 RepID=S7ZWN6_DACHA|nr:hypothetical protein H072_11507 [Dactylellina haptotyla CBS 200.50]
MAMLRPGTTPWRADFRRKVESAKEPVVGDGDLEDRFLDRERELERVETVSTVR